MIKFFDSPRQRTILPTMFRVLTLKLISIVMVLSFALFFDMDFKLLVFNFVAQYSLYTAHVPLNPITHGFLNIIL